TSQSLSSVSVVSLHPLLLLFLCMCQASAAPICVHGQAGCHFLSLADLFDRVIQHSARMHSISSDLHSEFEQYVLPSRNHIGRINRHCHTATILTPNGKENAQRLAVSLTTLFNQLLFTIVLPLSASCSNLVCSLMVLPLSASCSNLVCSLMVLPLSMQHLGMISNSLSGLSSPEALDPSSDTSGESQAMSDHDLLYCFRRDSNKVQNYLKILKCRIVPENGC
uniref:Prolactin 2 n=1 Tax=Oncorhynchus kisutch TaxID=8019 RepID=A0A8C7J712_ONCKI